MLEIEPRFSARSESTLSYQAISSVPSVQNGFGDRSHIAQTGLELLLAKVDLELLIASVFRVLGL